MKNRGNLVSSLALILLAAACSSSGSGSTNTSSGGEASVGGSLSSGGSSASGGALPGGTNSQGGAIATGGASALVATGGKSTAVTSPTGGSNGTGGGATTGGFLATGGVPVSTGGARATGGSLGSGGSVGLGGSPTGGAPTSGGSRPTGGASSTATGGTRNTGGTSAAVAGQSAGGSTAGGGSSYSPCAASPCKILPFGDSITHGLQSTDSGGYRSQLFKLVVAGGQTLTFLGSQSAGPATVSSVTFPKNHEGHDGYTVDSGYSTYGTAGISSLIPTPAFSTIPDIVLLHIGTNDITSTGSAASTTSTRLDGLITKIVGVAPKALIVVAQITPVSYTSADLTTYNSKIPGIVQTHAASGQHIILANMSQMPKTDLASDGVHPNDQGYAYMANIWYTAIKGYLR